MVFSAGLGEKTSLLVGYGVAESDSLTPGADLEPESIFLGLYHNMGGGLRLYLESTNVDFDPDNLLISELNPSEGTRTLLGMRIDF